jgi:hypothetical protein
MDVAGLLSHAVAAGGFAPEFLPSLAAITVTTYYAVKAVTFLLAVTVAVCTGDPKRRDACIEIIRIMCRGWPWPPRLPGSRA